MNNNGATDQGLVKLTKLEDLNLCYNQSITNNGISHLVNLKRLLLNGNGLITSQIFSKLVNLEYILVNDNKINAENIKELIKVKTIDIIDNHKRVNRDRSV